PQVAAGGSRREDSGGRRRRTRGHRGGGAGRQELGGDLALRGGQRRRRQRLVGQLALDRRQLLGHLVGAAQALLAVLGEHAPQQALEAGRDAAAQLRDLRRLLVEDLVDEGGDGLAVERPLGRQQLEEDHAEREEVAAAVQLLAADLFRRQVLRAAHDRAGDRQLGVLPRYLGDPEVGHLHPSGGVEQD